VLEYRLKSRIKVPEYVPGCAMEFKDNNIENIIKSFFIV